MIASASNPEQEAQDILLSLKGDLSYALEDVPPWYKSGGPTDRRCIGDAFAM